MDGFWKLLDRLGVWLKVLGAACLVGMMFLTCADVVGRHFRHPIFGSVEIVGFLSTLAVAMSLPYTHKVKGHIGVEILARMLSEKTQAILDIVTGILSLGLFGIVTWRMWVYAGTIKDSGEVSMNLEFPEFTVIYAVAFCFFIFSLMILQDIIRDIKQLKGNK